ncbi:MAG: HD domain-containing protein [Actinobacteria bacterium]|nr:HD domain-containing protein [Actinomycetota bacterium]
MCANDGDVAYTVPPTRGRTRNDTVVMGAVQRRLESMYPYMKGHWQRVAFEAAGLGEELELSREDLEQLRICAYLMDIGMIDESIHALVAKCTERGADYMQNADIRRAVERHPLIGARKLEELGFPRPVVLSVRHHHEWYNGWGYPDGLSGVAIPVLGRILGVADAFVSLTSERPFRPGCSPAEALDEIVGYSGVQFDPWVVPALEKVVTQKSHVTESLIDKTLDLAAEEFEA